MMLEVEAVGHREMVVWWTNENTHKICSFYDYRLSEQRVDAIVDLILEIEGVKDDGN